MMKKHIFSLAFLPFLFIAFLSFTDSEIRKARYENGQLKYQVDINNGMFNGKYVSWYVNGRMKAEGTFKNNQRIGLWTVYDSLGRERMIRNYKNSFQFEVTKAKNSQGENIVLPMKVNYNLIRTQTGYYQYQKLLEKDVTVSKRLWRTISPNIANSMLFKNDRLFTSIVKNITETKKLTPFDTISDEFKSALTIADIKDKIADAFDVIGYKIKEDWFFNSSWQLSETRIIGICPVIKNKNSGKTTALCWIYYPELRAVLAAEKVKIIDDSAILTIADIFMFRHFNSSIYKESNVYDRQIADYKKGDAIKTEEERIEMHVLDLEHDVWIDLTEIK